MQRIVSRPVPFISTALVCALVGCSKRTPQAPRVETYAVGIREPATVPADEVKIPEDRTVIGICVGEHCRAYLLDAFKPHGVRIDSGRVVENADELGKHVVNDVLGGIPITVTHCDLSGCCRVFTADGEASLDVAVTGLQDGHMELSLLRERFLQESPDAPLSDYAFQLATWEEWREMHPDSDLYLGEIPNVDPAKAGRQNRGQVLTQ